MAWSASENDAKSNQLHTPFKQKVGTFVIFVLKTLSFTFKLPVRVLFLSSFPLDP